MTDEQIGRRIAEKVMGWRYVDYKNGGTVYNRQETDAFICHISDFTPLTDLNQAFEALEKWHGNSRDHETVITLNYKIYTVEAYSGSKHDIRHIMEDESLARAICLALVKATEE